MFISAFTWPRHFSASSVTLFQSMPSHHTSWRSIIILSSLLRLIILIGLYSSGIPTETLHTTIYYSILAIYPAHLIRLDVITRKILSEQYNSISYSICSFVQSQLNLYLFNPNILINTLLSHTLSLRSTQNGSDQVSHPYITSGKIIFLFILIPQHCDVALFTHWLGRMCVPFVCFFNA